jgi:hypothetical protein
MQNNKPFSGNLSITFNEKNMSLNSGKAIQMVFPRDYVMKDKLEKDFVKYKESGKTKYEDLFGCIDASDIESEFSDGIFSALFGGFISEFMLNSYSDYDYDYDYDYEGEGRPKRYKERKAATFTKQVEGHMIDGVPVGLWVFKDQKGNFAKYKAHKSAVFKNPGKTTIDLDNFSIIDLKNYAIVTFTQKYQSNTINDTGKKILYLNHI